MFFRWIDIFVLCAVMISFRIQICKWSTKTKTTPQTFANFRLNSMSLRSQHPNFTYHPLQKLLSSKNPFLYSISFFFFLFANKLSQKPKRTLGVDQRFSNLFMLLWLAKRGLWIKKSTTDIGGPETYSKKYIVLLFVFIFYTF